MTSEGVPREEYTWLHASKDLALTTTLSIYQVGRLTWELEQRTDLHPYDVLPILSRVFQHIDPEQAYRIVTGMIQMIELSRRSIDASKNPQSLSERA